MTIDINAEELLTVSQAAQRTPTKVSESTVWKWLFEGRRGVKLESCVIGGRRLTSAEALQRFFEKVTEAANEEVVG